MFLLDTSVVSELMRPELERTVEAWVAGQAPKDLFLSTASEAELRYGAAILPAGRRRETLSSDIEGMLRRAFGDRVLRFDRQRRVLALALRRRHAGSAARRRPGCRPDRPPRPPA